jgi:hypothetical protein
MAVFWDDGPCCVVETDLRFRGAYSPHHQGICKVAQCNIPEDSRLNVAQLKRSFSDFYLCSLLSSRSCRWGETVSLDCGYQRAYCSSPRWYMNSDTQKQRTRKETCSIATSSITNPTWTDPGANPGLRCERPATNRLSRLLPSASYQTLQTPSCQLYFWNYGQ